MNFTCDLSDLQRFAEDLQKFAEELPQAAANAVNRTGDQMTTAIGRTLSDETGLGYKRQGKARYPIEVLYGPNVAAEAWKGQTRNVAAEVVNDVLPRRLAHEIGRLWPRSKG